jgi:signal transduction histidine kinase
LLYLGVIWCGFFAVHLHLDFPSRVNLPHRTVLLILLASLSGFLTLLFCGRNLDFMPEGSQRILWLVGLIVFSFEMLAVIGSVCKSYLRASSADERYRAGIIVLATILGIIPVLLFSVLPDVLMGRTLIPHEFSFLGLLAFPLGYGFAILRLKLVHLDSTMDRGAALTFVILIITGFYTLAFSFLSRFFPGVYDQYSLAGLVITILIAVSSRRLYGSLLIWINRVLYGEWYDYRSAIHMINDHLKSVETEFQSITTTFCQVVMKSLQLDFVAMISHDRWYTLVETGNEPCSVHVPDQYFESIWSVITASDTSKSLESHSNQSILAPILSDRLMPRIQLVMPIQSQEEIFGLLILGRKRGGGVFESSDMDVLDVAIHQAQISLEKARLLVDVREYSNDIRELHRKVTQTREEERKQVARELHDQVIQSLVSLNYRLSEMRRRSVHTKDEDIQTVQNDVVSVIGNVRQICTNLRPPVLDSLDLASAFRSKIDEHLGQTAFNIHFFVHGDNEKDIPEPVRSYAYRFLQESLTNVSKHARAQNVEVHLSIKADEIIIIVQDDGKGFPGPTHLGLFEKAQHFGLISLLEDARSLNGTLEIDSSIGEGCCLVATIPLASECYSK